MSKATTTTNKPKLKFREFIERIQAMPDGPEKSQALELALKKYNERQSVSKTGFKRFRPYRYDPVAYIDTFLKWTAWIGMDAEHPGQAEILRACALVMKQQHEKDLWEKGKLKESDLTCWKPGQKIKNWIRVESGNGIGKTKSASGILNWFLDCFVPSAIFTYAPGGDQARFVIWSEIRGDRTGKGLPGRILETEIKVSEKHFAAHRTVSVGKGVGEERAKGKHEAYQLFVLDEADGIDEVIFNSIVSQTSGGQNLVIMFANPKSRASMFHRIKNRSYVQTFRVSTLFHPNVRAGKEVIPNAVKRDFVENKIENDCEIIHACAEDCELTTEEHEKLHDDDEFTFELPYSVNVGGVLYPPGTIFRPNARFMTDILGITPPNSTDKTVIPVGRFEAACQRTPTGAGDPSFARAGIDASRSGADNGTMYIRHLDAVERAAEIPVGDTYDYLSAILPPLLKLKEKGVTSLHIRIDAAYGNGLIDVLRRNDELLKAFKDFKVFEVWFNGTATNPEYYDIATEMYYEMAETIKTLCIKNPPEKLEIDLCEREYEWRNVSGKDKKKLEPKDDFKKRKKHSPDDGDGCVLACAPDFMFKGKELFKGRIIGKTSRWK